MSKKLLSIFVWFFGLPFWFIGFMAGNVWRILKIGFWEAQLYYNKKGFKK